MSDQACYRCGDERAMPVCIERHGVEIVTRALCDRCFDELTEQARQDREVFNALLASGMPRAEANAIMIRRIDERDRGPSGS